MMQRHPHKQGRFALPFFLISLSLLLLPISLFVNALLAAKLAQTMVTLAAGASQAISIGTQAIHFAVPGALPLIGIAKSEGNPAVKAATTAAMLVPTSTLSPVTWFRPASAC
jgi:hypothetical protein